MLARAQHSGSLLKMEMVRGADMNDMNLGIGRQFIERGRGGIPLQKRLGILLAIAPRFQSPRVGLGHVQDGPAALPDDRQPPARRVFDWTHRPAYDSRPRT